MLTDDVLVVVVVCILDQSLPLDPWFMSEEE